MSGPKRNPDKLNTIGIVVVGICGAVMVYVTIAGLQAFYMNDTSQIQHAADYRDMDVAAKGHKADEMRNITEAATNAGAPTYRIPIDHAMTLVVEQAKVDPSHLVPTLPKADKSTIVPAFGRPTPTGGEAGAGAAPPSGEGGTLNPTSGAAAPSAPQSATGSPGPGGGPAGPGTNMVPSPTSPPPPPPGAVPPLPAPGAPPAAGSAAQPKAKAPAAQPKAQPKAAGSAAPKTP